MAESRPAPLQVVIWARIRRAWAAFWAEPPQPLCNCQHCEAWVAELNEWLGRGAFRPYA